MNFILISFLTIVVIEIFLIFDLKRKISSLYSLNYQLFKIIYKLDEFLFTELKTYLANILKLYLYIILPYSLLFVILLILKIYLEIEFLNNPKLLLNAEYLISMFISGVIYYIFRYVVAKKF